MGALSGKLETVLELECPPGKFLKAWKSEAHQIPKHAPHRMHSVELHEGDWDSDKGSSIKFWEYSIGGKRETFKERVEVDEAKNIIKLTGLEGDPMKLYKLEPKGQGTLATCIIEYEKVKEDVLKEIAAAVATPQALSGKLETVLELDCPPGKFLKAWKSEAHQIPKHTPNNIHSVELHEGDWEHDQGPSIKFWEYSVGGKRETFKERVEVDEAKNIIKLTGLEGDVMKIYKVFNPTYKLEPKGQGTLATLMIEYEKVDEDVPNPDIYMDFMISLTKDIAAAALSGKLETVHELDCPPGKFLEAWKSEAHQIPKYAPNLIHYVEVHEGDWEADKGSSIKLWEYSVGGKHETFKEREEVDEANNVITLTGLEGDPMKIYKALSGKLETVHELDCLPGKFLKAWKSEAHQIPKHAPNHIHSVEVHEGDWEHDQGPSIKFWEYSVGGKRESLKERVELDEANKIIKFTVLEGDVFNPIYKLEAKGQGTLATLAIEFEKANEDVPNPDIYLDFMLGRTKEIDAAIGKA
ncbi:hypothetical protein Tsubulata_042589 [Turnera subulata]|uniref:Bet v I/Major latex protein domain-containing protein n=1 Tax=Turnera subulata TaxID=218843 RepID=A0A9Q0GF28_9ROSI|nr:hypothetical protein Tsubulata_042589 [Turnera subulata]